MTLKGEARREYMREYMRRRRAGEKPQREAKPQKRVVAELKARIAELKAARREDEVAAIENGRILKALKQWKTNKNEKQIWTKALDLIEAIGGAGRGTNAHMKLRNRWAEECDEQGLTISFGAVFGSQPRDWPKWAQKSAAQKAPTYKKQKQRKVKG